jgi:uncharacterized protein YecE (DUF72 family)
VAVKIYVGTAGWRIPRPEQARFPSGDSHLARYAKLLPAVEINSTFYRTHRTTTFERWAANVPSEFRFAVKCPRTITHDQRLVNGARLIEDFLLSLAPIDSRIGCLLVQLAPSLPFHAGVAREFLSELRNRFDRGIAIEPRHQSWFDSGPDQLLDQYEVARVAADPPRAEGGSHPGGWRGFAYFRLHGSPRTYYSAYENDFLDSLAEKLQDMRSSRIPSWCIFDNTALGAATDNALSLLERFK